MLSALAAILLAPSFLAAQTLARNFGELRLKIQTGDSIYVTDETGRETHGKVLSLSDSTLVLSDDGGRREFTEATVQGIRQRQPDSLLTGALIGAAAGGGLGVAAATFSDECSYAAMSARCVGPALLMTGLGIGIGIGVDALIQGRKPIYEASGASVRVSPLLAPGRTGVHVTVVLAPGSR
ncbi:MAG: hypothetical protein ACM3SQ_02625 [Betaproteobacteria bacterium]